MLLLLVLVFFGVFVVVALLLTATGTSASQQTEQTLTVLQAALATQKMSRADPIVDIRKEELLSAVPWINRWLLKIELAPRLRTLLYQADLKWTAGSLLLMSVVCFAIPAYLIYLRTGAVLFALLIGLLLGAAPFVFVLYKRSPAFCQVRSSSCQMRSI